MARTYTMRFAGVARVGDEIHAFHAYGPSPTAMVYSDVLWVFPNTKKGWLDAQHFSGEYGVQRGEWQVEDEFTKVEVN